jgi:DNA topoisomerase-1
MADARGHHLVVEVANKGGEKREVAVFRANGKAIEFPGYLRAYVEGADDPDQELADKETLLPDVSTGDPMECQKLESKTHTTNPPPRYTEASLVKELEANGIGRPSTYAAIIDTILRREYVVKEGNSLVPTFMAFAVVGLLEKNFEDLVDIEFTARMEDDLDAISLGSEKQLPYLKSFYYGRDGKPGLKPLVEKDIDARESCTLPLGKDPQGRAVNVRIGRYGPYLEREGERVSIPAGIAPDELTLEKAIELLEKGAGGPRKLGDDPFSGKEVFVKVGRFGPYVQLGEASENGEKPRMKSLLPGMDPETVGLEDALKLLALPRSLGTDPETGIEVFADFGRYGPYVKRGDDTRSLPKDAHIFDVTLERAIQALKEEKKGPSWRSRGPTVLRELGMSPDAAAPVKLLEGRYGPYVTDGTTNASIPRDAKPEDVTLEQAMELLRARAAAGPSKKGRFAKKASKKAGGTAGAAAGKKKSSARSAKSAAEESPDEAEPETETAGASRGAPSRARGPGKPGKPAGKSRKRVG